MRLYSRLRLLVRQLTLCEWSVQLAHSFDRLLHQVSGSVKCEQCICIWDVRIPDTAPPTNSLTFLYRKEQLGLYGNQLNYMQTAWTVGYVIGQVPSNILLTRIRPSLWIPTMEVSRNLLYRFAALVS